MEKLLQKMMQDQFIRLAKRTGDDLDAIFQQEVDFTLVVHSKDRKVTHISTAQPEEQIAVLQEIIKLMENKQFQFARVGPNKEEMH